MEDKEKKLRQINQQLKALVSGEDDYLANLSNAAALLYNELEKVNWAGFYLMKEGELVLGPFQGLPACIRIKVGNGVCGSAVEDEKTYVVEDVHQFEGHIACDSASESENDDNSGTKEAEEKKKELEKLANSLNENDNPVLMLVKLKE